MKFKLIFSLMIGIFLITLISASPTLNIFVRPLEPGAHISYTFNITSTSDCDSGALISHNEIVRMDATGIGLVKINITALNNTVPERICVFKDGSFLSNFSYSSIVFHSVRAKQFIGINFTGDNANFTNLLTNGINLSDINNSYLAIDGSNANQNIDIFPYNLTMGERLEIGDGVINFTTGNVFNFNHGIYIRGANPFLDIGSKLLVGTYAKIDEYLYVEGNLTIMNDSYFEGGLFPLTTLTWDIGSGAYRWNYLYVTNISADYADIAYDLDVDGTIYADTINATHLNITTINVDVFNVTTINASYIYNPYFAGAMDLRGDPWYIQGTDLQIAENLLVDGNITAYNITILNDLSVGNLGTFGNNVLISKDVNAGDVNLIIRNTAGAISSDETVSLIAQTLPEGANMGKIVFGRLDDYGVATRESFMDFYTAESPAGVNALALRIDSFQNFNFQSGDLTTLGNIDVGAGDFSDNIVITKAGSIVSHFDASVSSVFQLDRGAVNRGASYQLQTAGVTKMSFDLANTGISGDGTEGWIGTAQANYNLWMEADRSVTFGGDLNATGDMLVDKIALGSNTLDGLSSGDINVSTIYKDAEVFKSPQISCSDNWCSVGFPKQQKTLWIQKDDNWTILDIVYNGTHYTKQEFWKFVEGTQYEELSLKLNNKIKRLQNKRQADILLQQRKDACNYYWDGECYEIVFAQTDYSGAVQITQVNETEKVASTCLGLDDMLQVVNYNCTIEQNTGRTINQYHFKDDCNWNVDDGYYCIGREAR